MNIKSCIQTIKSLQELALNTYGEITATDERNFRDIIFALEKQEAIEPEYEIILDITVLERCPKCHRCVWHKEHAKEAYCYTCGQHINLIGADLFKKQHVHSNNS